MLSLELSQLMGFSRAFIPVTDGTYVTGLPSVLLDQRRVNGLRLLAGVSELSIPEVELC
jgi:hypothetical protein